jgi:hypothetical protein
MTTETTAQPADTSAVAEQAAATPAARVIYESHAEDGAGEKNDAGAAEAGAEKKAKTETEDAGKPAAETGKDEAKDEESRTQARRRQRREAMERANADAAKARAEAERLRKQIEESKPVDPNKAEDYEAAIAQNAANAVFARQNEGLLKDAEATLSAAQEQAREAREAAWNEHIAELSHISDLKAKITSDDFKITKQTAALIIDDAVIERGPELAYFLANNPQELARIESLPLHQRSAQLVRLEAKLPALARKTTSTAPEPLDRVSGKNAGVGIDLETASYADYKRARGLD